MLDRSIGLRGDGATMLGEIAASYADPADEVILLIDGGVIQTSGAIDVSGSTGASAIIRSTGGANRVGAIEIGQQKTSVAIEAETDLIIDDGNSGSVDLRAFDTDDPSSITITGAGFVDLNELDGDVHIVDASGSTGGLALINRSSTIDVIGSAGDDLLGSLANLSTGSFDAGAGTDRLIVASNGVIASNADGAKFSGFEAAQVENTVQLNLDFLPGIESVFLNDTAAANTVLTNLTPQQARNVTALSLVGEFQLEVKDASRAGQVDTLTITVDDLDGTASEAANIATPLIYRVETVNLVAVDDIHFDTLTNTGNLGASDIARLGLSGEGDVRIETGLNVGAAVGASFGANTTVDASDLTGALQFVALRTESGSALSITGGSSDDFLGGTRIASATGDVLDGGPGDDVLFGDAGNDVLTGGPGEDLFAFIFYDTFGTPGATSFDIVTDYEPGIDTIGFVSPFDPTPLEVVQATANAAPGTAQIDSQGIATFNAVDDTLQERIVAVEEVVGDTPGGFAVFEHEGDSYLFVAAGDGALDEDDLLVQLSGVTGLSRSEITYDTTYDPDDPFDFIAGELVLF